MDNKFVELAIFPGFYYSYLNSSYCVPKISAQELILIIWDIGNQC